VENPAADVAVGFPIVKMSASAVWAKMDEAAN
jgi:hypothetical protein